MSDPVWSRVLPHQIAQILGYRLPKAVDKTGLVDFDSEAEQMVKAVTEAFRYLPAEKVQCALDFAEFLRMKIDGCYCPPPATHVALKFRELRDLLLSLRDRFETAQPADEKDYWTEEDERDLTRDTLRRLEADDPWPDRDNHRQEDQRDAEKCELSRK